MWTVSRKLERASSGEAMASHSDTIPARKTARRHRGSKLECNGRRRFHPLTYKTAVNKIPSVAQNGTDHEAKTAFETDNILTLINRHQSKYQWKVDHGCKKQAACG